MPVYTLPFIIPIYHILHIDRLESVINDGFLFSDSIISQRINNGSMIGIHEIKQRRMTSQLTSHVNLTVGQCVPFYFCPRSVMLYLIDKRNADLTYQDGQEPILHLQADFYQVIAWANQQIPIIRWAFTTSNAGSFYFDDYNDIADLNKIDWQAVYATNWVKHKENKQAEFLLEMQFPWHLVQKIGVSTLAIHAQVTATLEKLSFLNPSLHFPSVAVEPSWYY